MNLEKIITSPLNTNTYLIYNTKINECLVIDPGDSADKILKLAKKNNCTIVAVLLTHCHCDHANGCKELQENGAKIYLSENDLELTKSYKNLSVFMNVKFNRFVPDILLKGDETLNICNFEIKTLATPGHTAGGISYIFNSENVIFTGDTLFNGSYGRTDFPTGSYGDIKNSLNKLFQLEKDYKVYTGHGESTTLFKERANNLI